MSKPKNILPECEKGIYNVITSNNIFQINLFLNEYKKIVEPLGLNVYYQESHLICDDEYIVHFNTISVDNDKIILNGFHNHNYFRDIIYINKKCPN